MSDHGFRQGSLFDVPGAPPAPTPQPETPKKKKAPKKNAEEFWAKKLEQSKIKSEIVSKYFAAWAMIVDSNGPSQLGYLDLFAGRGAYEDNSPSTPMLVMEKILEKPVLARKTVTFFNDSSRKSIGELKSRIEGIPGVSGLGHAPKYECSNVGPEIAQMMRQITVVEKTPSLIFIDPFGYKGLTLDLIKSALQSWGCDCIFFFNYLRINPATENKVFKDHMISLFGAERFEQLESGLKGLDKDQREATILKAILDALASVGGQYTITLKFKKDQGNRTSHFLVLTSKDRKAYMLMKDIMAKHCEKNADGVPIFEYNKVSAMKIPMIATTFTLDQLKESLLKSYIDKESRIDAIYREHSIGLPYQERHYQAVFKKLEAEGRVIVTPPISARPTKHGETTMAPDKTYIRFPPI